MNIFNNKNIFGGKFIKNFGFWVFSGAFFLILVALFFVLDFPLFKTYTNSYITSENLSGSLDRYALKKILYNNRWIKAKELEAEFYKKEAEDCKAFLKEKDALIEAVFSVEDPEKGLVEIKDEALWKNEYTKRVSAVLKKFDNDPRRIDKEVLPFYQWDSGIPTWDEILPEQKKYWIIEAIADIVLRKKWITSLKDVSFRGAPHVYSASTADIYTPIPLTIKVRIHAEQLNFLLQEFLKSDIPFMIESANIFSTDQIYYGAKETTEDEGSTVKKTNRKIPLPVVEVVIDVSVIDYNS